MSWATAYRVALHLLPAKLRAKHGPAMEALFDHEIARARARGPLHAALTGAAAMQDVLQRGAYEQVRRVRAHKDVLSSAAPLEIGSRHMRMSDAGGTNFGDTQMPQPTPSQLLRRLATWFALSFVLLTAALLALYASRQLPALSARGALAGTVAEMILLAVPFTAAMTIPMSVLLAVLTEFTLLGTDGTLAAARHIRGGVRRLIVPVVAASIAVAGLALVVNTQIVPRANTRLTTVLAGRPASTHSDREMTIDELHAAVREARATSGPQAAAQAVTYEIEVQKKYALAAACVVLALVGVAIPLRVPRGGAPLMIAASSALYFAYYASLMTGAGLASRLVVSPFVGMWGPNALLFATALLALWWGSIARRSSDHDGAVMIR